LRRAIELKVNFINISGGGPEYSETEYQLIKRALDSGIKIVAAAGNDGHDISIESNRYYPASYDKRITVVGNLAENGSRAPSSNYGGPTNRWEVGTAVRARIPCTNPNSHNCSGKLTGTSMACAVATGKLVKLALKH
jgi:subtilisin family serine protease